MTTFGRNIQEAQEYSFHVGLLFINFLSLKLDIENNMNFTLYEANAPTLTR